MLKKLNEIENNGGSTLIKCIRFFYISQHGEVTKKNLFNKIKENISSSSDFLENLKHFSKFYAALNNDSNVDFETLNKIFNISVFKRKTDYTDRFVRTFSALKYFNVTQAYPIFYCLLKSFDRASNETSHAKNFLKICELIEKFHFQFFTVCSGRGNKVEKFYSDMAKDISSQSEPDLNHLYNTLKNHFLKHLPPWENFKNDFNSISYERNPKSKLLIHYIYDRISNYNMRPGAKHSLFFLKDNETKFANFNIDHIMPTKISELHKDIQNNIGNCMVVHYTDNCACNTSRQKKNSH